MPTQKIIIGNWVFESKSHLIRQIQSILHAPPIKSRVESSENQEFLAFLFAWHPDYFLKLAGRQITHFEVHSNTGGSRCFHAAFADGSSVHFSYKKCIDRAITKFKRSDADRDDLRYLPPAA